MVFGGSARNRNLGETSDGAQGEEDGGLEFLALLAGGAKEREILRDIVFRRPGGGMRAAERPSEFRARPVPA